MVLAIKTESIYQDVLIILVVLNFLILQVLMFQLEPDTELSKKAFQCPLVPLLPCLGIISNFVLCTVGVGQMEWVLFICFEILGGIFYFMYGYHNSLMPYKLVKYRVKMSNSLNYST